MSWFDILFGRRDDRLRQANYRVTVLEGELNGCNSSLAYYQNEYGKAYQEYVKYKQQADEALSNLASKDGEIAGLQQQVADYENSARSLESRAKELEEANSELLARIGELEGRPAPDLTPDYLRSRLKEQLPSINNRPQLWFDYLKALYVVFGRPAVTGYREVASDEVRARVDSAFPGLAWHSPQKDGKYRLITIAQAKGIIQSSFVSIGKYVPELWDCDKYSQALREHFSFYYLVNSCLEIWGYWGTVYHSWNLVVCQDGVLMVEPQTNEMAVLPEIVPDHKATEVHDW